MAWTNEAAAADLLDRHRSGGAIVVWGACRRDRGWPLATGRRALVGCSEGELHGLCARIIAHMLAERGWTVLLLGADTAAAAWPQIFRARRPDVALLCTTTEAVLGQVAPALHAIKSARPECRTIVGGQAYWGISDAAVDFGADLLTLDARTLPRRLQEPA